LKKRERNRRFPITDKSHGPSSDLTHMVISIMQNRPPQESIYTTGTRHSPIG